MKKTKKEKIRLVFISLVIVGLIVSLVSSVAHNWITILKNKKEIAQLSIEYNNLLTEEGKLKSEVIKLQDDDYIARYAKEKYLYSADGEVIIRLD